MTATATRNTTTTVARRRPRVWSSLAVGVALLASCGGDEGSNDGADASAEVAAPPIAPASASTQPDADADADTADEAYTARLDLLDAAVADWRDASTIEAAHVAAETAANLVVGPAGPGDGDRDGDGTVNGESDDGVLPGLDATPAGWRRHWRRTSASSGTCSADRGTTLVTGGTPC